MALILKQSTAVDVLIGPFVDETDGKTAETGLTISQADVRLSKNAQNMAQKNDSTSAAHDELGYYNCELDATDTNTVGTLVLAVHESGALPVRHEFQVVEEAIFDTMYADGADLESQIQTIDSNVDAILVDTNELQTDWVNGGRLDAILDAIQTDTIEIQGSGFVSSTDSLEAIRDRGDAAWTGSAATSNSGTAQAGSSTTITLESGASSVDDTYNGQLIHISSGTGVGQAKAIGDYVGSTKVATVIGTWATAPDSTSVYDVYPADIDEITSAPTAAAIADAVWDESTAGHTSSGTFGEQVKNDIDSILVDTGTTLDSKLDTIDSNVDAVLVDTGTTLPASIATIDSKVDAVLVDTATLGSPAGADFAADIAAVKSDTAAVLTDTGTTLAGKIDTIDTVVDAVKVQTDKLAFTVTNQVDANIQSINDVTITGDGDGTPFDV